MFLAYQQKPSTISRLISLQDLCKYLNRHRSTIYRWVKQGQFPPPKYLNKKPIGWRFDDIQAWLDAS